MYHKILIPLENSPADATILAHIKPLARMVEYPKQSITGAPDFWWRRRITLL